MAGSGCSEFLQAKRSDRRIHVAGVGLALAFLFLCQPLAGASERAVQVATGRIDSDSGHLYHLVGLKRGDMLFVHARGTSGNLDPLLFLLRPEVDFAALRQSYLTEIEQATATGRDLLPLIPGILDKISLA